MTALGKKLTRDLGRMWGQAVTIALVVACGIASFVAMRSAYDSLLAARDHYYAERRFADLFVHCVRAPEEVARRLEALPGVAQVHTRVVDTASIPLGERAQPATGQIVTLPISGTPPLNRLHLRRGRLVEPGRADEAVVLETFAEAHHKEVGDTLQVVIRGTQRTVKVVGVAVSPEYVFAVAAASITADPERFGVLWMDREATAPLFRMEGSFNDVVLALLPGASPERVLAEVRRELEPYGVAFAVARDRQPSHRILEGELSQLRQFALVTPMIFLGVAAFLVHVVMTRLLHLERGSIATLKALGYGTRRIALHYVTQAALIVGAGAVLGLLLGDVLGRGMLSLYRPYFRFESLEHQLRADTVAIGVGVSLLAAVLGGLGAVLRATRIPAAEAMQPEAPPAYGRTWVERLGLLSLLGPGGRMIARELLRRPLRTALSCLGIALGSAVVGGARFTYDAMDLIMDLQFEGAQREDLEVVLREPLPRSVVHELAALPGVVEAQPHRTVPVRARRGPIQRDTAILGFADAAVPLRTAATWPRADPIWPEDGIVLGEQLAKVLDVRVGELLELELLEGDRRTLTARVTGTLPDMLGLLAYARVSYLERWLGEEGNVTSVLLRTDPLEERRTSRRLAELPQVVTVQRRRDALDKFQEQAEHIWVTTGVLTAFGAIIAFGVVYNHARVALGARARDLASLRVLGFTRREISSMLLGELAFYVIVGIPIGSQLGKTIVLLITSTIDPETYRLPAYMSLETHAFAALVTIGSAVASALLVRRRLDRLDLVGVLKAKD